MGNEAISKIVGGHFHLTDEIRVIINNFLTGTYSWKTDTFVFVSVWSVQ